MVKAAVAVLKTSPQTVLADYTRLMQLIDYQSVIAKETDLLLKLNLSWSLYFPACSSQPWQLEGVVKTLIEDGFGPQKILPVENKTVVTDPWKGAKSNKWLPVLEKYDLKFIALNEIEWTNYRFKSKLLVLNEVFPEGIMIPKMFIGKQVLHLPTMKTHGHSITTGAVKNSFGGLLREVRHYTHKHIHEGLVDLMLMQKELHPSIFAVMDGTVAGDGAGPRTMIPKIANLILASSDSVALDAIAAKIMGFDPMEIPYLKMCHERGLGVADPSQIEMVGDDISQINLHFKVSKSLVIWGDQLLRLGPLKFLEKIALHSPLWRWAPLASNIYHDWIWYPTLGRKRVGEFMKTEWGELFQTYA